MVFSWLPSPLALIPQPVTAISLGVLLNAFFNHYPELRERLQELSGKVFHFDVEDLHQSYYMRVEPDGMVRIHTYSDEPPDVTMAGESTAFVSLLISASDPDSLFFSRQLKLSGETDTGLRFKNLLDNVDIDWEQELSLFVGTPAAMLAGSVARTIKEQRAKVRATFAKGSDAFMERKGWARKSEMDRLKKGVEELSEDLERLERSVTRAANKVALARSSGSFG